MVEEISNSKIYKKLLQHDKKFIEVIARFDEHENTLNRHGDVLGDHSVQIQNLKETIDRIDERTAFIPKMYDAMDAFMPKKEIL